tara:strand:- start:195 stop:704 length:510 start_codon:yes stop_codon:yes gene_type:complete
MAVLQILTIPDPRLKYKSINVENFDKNLEKIINDMFDTLSASGNGIGLAAPQVNIHQRIIVMDLREDEKSNPQIFINPRIIKFSSEKNINEEGCLSIPEFYAEVERPSKIEVEWFDSKGKKLKKEMTGLLSICMQHEIDHLNGVLFIDHISKLKKKMVLQKFKKLKTKQ